MADRERTAAGFGVGEGLKVYLLYINISIYNAIAISKIAANELLGILLNMYHFGQYVSRF